MACKTLRPEPRDEAAPACWGYGEFMKFAFPQRNRPAAPSRVRCVVPAHGCIFDHGAYSRICTPSSSSGGAAVDVAANGAEAWSAAYDFGCQRASKHVGAWAPAPWNGTVPFEWVDPAEYAKVDFGSMP